MKETKSVQDYLEAILVIQEEQGHCRSVDVANHLGFSKPSVSIAMRNLEQEGYVSRSEEGYLLLTERGVKVAAGTLGRHRLLKALLISIGVSPEVAEEDACGMEHALSEESFARLKEWCEARDD